MRINRKYRIIAGVTIAVLAVVAATATAATATAGDRSPAFAKAQLRDAGGRVVGIVLFETEHHAVTVRARATLPSDSAEFHGFHIHANNPDPTSGIRPGCDAATAFTSVGGHWDVGGHSHGRHTGDLPSLVRKSNGEVRTRFVVDKFTARDLLGHAVVVHVGADNFGNVPLGTAANQYTDNGTAYNGTGGTAATGNAGARFACGVIEPMSEELRAGPATTAPGAAHRW
jgi:superoxide dismutase, Cu-Zn family